MSVMPEPFSILPVVPNERDGELDPDESKFILDACLKPKNRSDSIVVAFIDSFTRCKSIAQASVECGIHQSLGYKIRHRTDVANCIQRLIDKSTVKHGFDTSEILERTKEIVDFDPIAVQNPDGTFKNNFHDIPPEARRNIKSLKVKNIFNTITDINGIKSKIITGEIIEFEFYDKLKATEMVGKEKQMFKTTTRVEHDVTKNMESLLLGSKDRSERFIEATFKSLPSQGETSGT